MLLIIDCTEVFIEKPSDLLVQAQVWSNYKHHLTLTFLIGVTPQGTISYVYIPLCWWCKEIVECSNLTDYLLIVIADRGLPVMIMPRWLLLRLKLHCLRKARSNWRRLRWIGVENCQLFASMLNEWSAYSSRSTVFPRFFPAGTINFSACQDVGTIWGRGQYHSAAHAV